jgi:EmrB/QacA subfamily drug resistance transporter
MDHGHATEAPRTADSGRWLALTLLALAQFMLIVDISVVQVALPTIGADLALGRESLTWVVMAYTLVFGGLMVLGGRLTDAYGARRVLLVGLTVFTLASLACGFARTGAWLIAARAGQGLGAALLSPAALATITMTFHGRDRNRALGVWAAIGGTGAAVGVLLSGVLVAGPGWEWAFFINVPIGALVFLLLPRFTPPGLARGTGGSVDVPGAIVVTTATAALIYGLVAAGDVGWAAPSVLVPAVAAAVGYGAFVLIEARTRNPLMQPRTMARRPVVSGAFLMLVATGLMLGLFFLTTLYLQHVLGLNALQTGLLFLPVALAVTAGAQAGAHLIGRVGGRVVAAVGLAFTAAGAALLAQVAPDADALTGVLPGFVLAALGLGPAFVTATTTTLANVPRGESGVASGVVNTFHELGGTVGVALVSTVAAAGVAAASAVDTAASGGFTSAYIACAVVAAATAVIAAVIVPPGRPQGVVGHGHGH